MSAISSTKTPRLPKEEWILAVAKEFAKRFGEPEEKHTEYMEMAEAMTETFFENEEDYETPEDAVDDEIRAGL